MRTTFHDAAFIKNENLIGIANSGETVGNDESCPPSHQAIKHVQDYTLGARIER